jgi:hypothetical protein
VTYATDGAATGIGVKRIAGHIGAEITGIDIGEQLDPDTVTGSERESLWHLMAAIWPGYQQYRELTSRQIPVVAIRRT